MERVKLGENVNIKTGKLDANASNVNGKYPFFTCSNEPLRINNYSYECECVLVAGNGDLNVKYYNGKFDAYQRTYIIEPKNRQLLETKYLYYLVNSKIDRLRREAIGGVIKYIKLGNLSNIEFVLIDIEKQKSIINVLDKVQEIIDIRKEQIKKLDELVKSKFVEMFGSKEDGFRCSKTEFNNCVKNMLKGPFGSDIKKSLYVPKSSDTYKVYIQMNAINKNQTLGDYWISKEYFDSKMFKFELKPKDYIATCDGTLGKLLRLDENMEKGIISASLLRITLDESVITPEYFENVWYLFMLDEMRKDIRNACLTHLPSAKVIGKIEIPLPSIEQQKEFSKIIKLIDKQKFEIQKSLEEMQVLQESLMNKFFGE